MSCLHILFTNPPVFQRRRRSTARREPGAAPARHAPLRQQSSLGDSNGKASPKAGGRSKGSRSALMRQQSDLFDGEQEDGVSPSRRKGKGRKPMGERLSWYGMRDSLESLFCLFRWRCVGDFVGSKGTEKRM